MDDTEQMKFWKGDFGNDYVDRNSSDWDEFYLKTWGITRSDLNSEFLENIPKDARILEVGCNVGKQLQILKKHGFTNLYGVEINKKAIQVAREDKDFNLIEASGFDIPFKDGFFDLVFTSGVLIHISPDDLGKIMGEIYRVSNKYIWGFEYFAEECTNIEYRGHTDRLWKNNFSKVYQEKFENLQELKSKKVPYVDGDNVDVMFLLEKQ